MRLAAVPFLAGLALLLPASPGRTQNPAVTTELVRLTTADGRSTTGVVYTPAGRPARAGIALVHGYASNFYSGAVGHLSRALAERGVATISVNMRDHDAGPKTTLFEENRWDEQAAIDELARRGLSPLGVVGASLGTNRVLYYVAETQDPRVRFVVLLAGPGNAFEWNVRMFGREPAARVLADAQARQAAGRGAELMLVDLGPLGKALYSADHLVSLRGPETKSDPYRNIARVSTPILLVYATADRLVERAVGQRLKAAATGAPRADLVELAGANHSFSQHQRELAETVDRWLGEILGR